MVFEIVGDQGHVKDQPNITISFASNETEDLVDTVLGILIHKACETDELEDCE